MNQITVIGVGGAGCSIVSSLYEEGVTGVTPVCVDADKVALDGCCVPLKLQIGIRTTGGLSAAGDMEKGMRCAEENKEELTQLLQGKETVILVCGMGGGIGGGAAPVIAEIARELEIMTIGIAVKPFRFEGAKRVDKAQLGIEHLQSKADAFLLLFNDDVLEDVGRTLSMKEGMKVNEEKVKQVVLGIEKLSRMDGEMGVDLKEIRDLIRKRDHAYIGVGAGTDGAMAVANRALDCLRGEMNQEEATELMIDITGDILFHESNEAANYIQAEMPEHVNILFSVNDDQETENWLRMLLIAIVKEK